jgi:hypothetical protein
VNWVCAQEVGEVDIVLPSITTIFISYRQYILHVIEIYIALAC